MIPLLSPLFSMPNPKYVNIHSQIIGLSKQIAQEFKVNFIAEDTIPKKTHIVAHIPNFPRNFMNFY